MSTPPQSVTAANPSAPPGPDRWCLKCGYPLSGIVSSRCPECGTPYDPADRFSYIGVTGPRWALRFLRPRTTHTDRLRVLSIACLLWGGFLLPGAGYVVVVGIGLFMTSFVVRAIGLALRRAVTKLYLIRFQVEHRRRYLWLIGFATIALVCSGLPARMTIFLHHRAIMDFCQQAYEIDPFGSRYHGPRFGPLYPSVHVGAAGIFMQLAPGVIGTYGDDGVRNGPMKFRAFSTFIEIDFGTGMRFLTVPLATYEQPPVQTRPQTRP